MSSSFDLFISFHPDCVEPVQRLRTALEAVGVACFAGSGTEPFRLPPELAQAKAFLGWCSKDYFRSRACQQHLAAAYLACEGQTAPAAERLLLVNAETGTKHIYPVALRDRVFALAPGLPGAAACGDLAGLLETHVRRLEGALGDRGAWVQPDCRQPFDRLDRPAPRCEGRERELWDIHLALWPAPGNRQPGSAVVVSGAAGQGKSALAREYAFRFGPAYPGGIFRLSAAAAKPAPRLAELSANPPLRIQLAALLRQLAPDADAEELDAPALSLALGRHLAEMGQPFLWIVDGLPDGLNGPAFRQWLAPDTAGGFGHSLVTTRTQRYDARATPLHLPPLDPDSALNLLFCERAPADEAEREAAAWLLETLSRHGGAMATAGALGGLARRGRRGPFDALCRRLEGYRRVAADLAGRQPERLPAGRETELTALFLCALQNLTEPALDILRLAAEAADAALPKDFVAACLRLSGLPMDDGKKNPGFVILIGEPPPEPMTAEAARLRTEAACTELERFALAEQTVGGVEVHPGAARIMAWTDPAPNRRARLRAAQLEALSDVVELCVGEGRCHALEPLAPHVRTLLADLRGRPIEAEEDPADISRRVRLALGLADLDRVHHDLPAALTGYRAAATYLARAMVADPGNGTRQRDYAVIQERIGEVEALRGELGNALDCFRKSLGIRTFLAGRDSTGAERQMEILRLHNRIAEILTGQGDAGGTLYSCRAAHAIYEKRAAEVPADISRRFDLGRSFERLAGLLLRTGAPTEGRKALDSALAVYVKLAEEHPDRMEFVRAPAAIHFLLGGFLEVRADLQGALSQYRTALGIAEKLVALEPDSAEEQRRLALCHGCIAQVLAALEDGPGAVEHYRAYLGIAEGLAGRARLEGVRKRDVATVCMKLGMELEQLDDPAEALACYRKARALLDPLARRSPGDQTLKQDLARLLEHLEKLDAAGPES